MVSVYGKLINLMEKFLDASFRSQFMLVAAILATVKLVIALKS